MLKRLKPGGLAKNSTNSTYSVTLTRSISPTKVKTTTTTTKKKKEKLKMKKTLSIMSTMVNTCVLLILNLEKVNISDIQNVDLRRKAQLNSVFLLGFCICTSDGKEGSRQSSHPFILFRSVVVALTSSS